MRHIPDRFAVILDTNLLYPFRVREVLLCVYQAGLFLGRWTEQISDESTSNLKAAKPELHQNIESQLTVVRHALP